MKNSIKAIILLMLIAPNFCTAEEPTQAQQLAGDLVVGAAEVVGAVVDAARREEQPQAQPQEQAQEQDKGICKISVRALSDSWNSNRDLSIRSGGAMGSRWVTDAMDEAGIAQGFYPCAQAESLQVVEEGLLFDRVLWSHGDSDAQARDRGIVVTTRRARRGEFRDAIPVTRAVYENMLKDLRTENDKQNAEAAKAAAAEGS